MSIKENSPQAPSRVSHGVPPIYDLNLQNKRVLITGATGGIGQALARAFYQAGAYVCCSGRSVETLQALKAQLETDNTQGGVQPGQGGALEGSVGDLCSIWPMDLSDSSSIQQVLKEILDAGPVDILINNGGITRDKLCIAMDEEDWAQVLQVNLTAPFLLSSGVLKTMMRRKWGRIINITSVVGFSGNKGQANYTASKGGLTAMTKTMALEFASRGITVNAIAPGYIQTAMTAGLSSAVKESVVEAIPCHRYGTPEEVACAALFLASPGAAYITGQTIHVNGGLW